MDEQVEYPKMDRGAKKRWVKALRSGKYKQAKGALVKRLMGGGEGFCCLGVYCDISTRVKREGTFYTWKGDEHIFGYASSSAMPDPLRQAINLDDRAQDRLMTMNDSDHYSFDEIADWIEANL